MDSQASVLRQLNNKNLSPDERALLRCQLAKHFEDTGEQEAARLAMDDLWQRIGERPHVEGLKQRTAAEVLLRAGVLTGWIGSSQQITDAQETARNLITESRTIFQSIKHGKKVAEAEAELARCYFKEGRYDEARVILKDVLARLQTDSELKAIVILRRAVVEWGAANYSEALRILTEDAPLFEKVSKHVIKGSYHNQLAMIFQTLAEAGQRHYLDNAFIEYTAASFHFEEAKHKRYLANVENNLGLLYFTANRYKEAHRHLDYARLLMRSLKDRVGTARVDETRARVFLAEKRYTEAEKAAQLAVYTLERNQHHSLAEALITHGKALARLGRADQARLTLYHAIEISEQAGAKNRAGEAALVIVRELGGQFKEVQTLSEKLPLIKELKRYEHRLIKQALISGGGSITRAARLLRTSHQHLSYLLEKRHKDLLALRTPAKRRLKSTIKPK
ncbi:MAG TPA: tetratricopeptide repeat protein [Pyrinomonadaceae bacterium]|jgi:tetratricopeptide (TPR) repeat protein